MTTGATSTTERIEIDPRQLLIDTNIRHDTRLDKEFIASIKELVILHKFQYCHSMASMNSFVNIAI